VLDEDSELITDSNSRRISVEEKEDPSVGKSLPPRSRNMSEAAMRRMEQVGDNATLYANVAPPPSNRFGQQEGAQSYASVAKPCFP
jgi:hypothetical protein